MSQDCGIKGKPLCAHNGVWVCLLMFMNIIYIFKQAYRFVVMMMRTNIFYFGSVVCQFTYTAFITVATLATNKQTYTPILSILLTCQELYSTKTFLVI